MSPRRHDPRRKRRQGRGPRRKRRRVSPRLVLQDQMRPTEVVVDGDRAPDPVVQGQRAPHGLVVGLAPTRRVPRVWMLGTPTPLSALAQQKGEHQQRKSDGPLLEWTS